jgi:hypothetical protein
MDQIHKSQSLNLIYVASIAFSGTTLFESILGAHSQIDTCGEIHVWPHELEQGGVKPTGSGQHVQESEFWREMRRRVDPLTQPSPAIHFFREFHHAGQTLRLEHLRDFAASPLSADTRAAVHQYGRNNYDVFHAFRETVAGRTGRRPTWVVDASKDPYRLLWLARSGLFNLKVFHLVKDPRSFAYSATRRSVEDDERLLFIKRNYFSARRSLAWVVQNALFTQVAEHHLGDGNYMLINYEELASSPKEVFEQACSMLGCDFEEKAVDNFRSGSPYAMAGNPMRQESRDIALDERWREQFPSLSRNIAWFVSSLNRTQYGY